MTRAHQTRRKGLSARLDLRPGEGARLGLMMLYAAAAFGGILTAGLVVSSALFLSRLPASATPYLFIYSAASIALTLVLYTRVTARVRFDQAALVSTVLLLVLALVFRLLLATPHGSSFTLLLGIYLYQQVAMTLVVMQFWVFAGQLFNPREARRLFGLMVLGGTLANVAVSFFLSVLVRFVGAEDLLFVLVAALAICAFCAFRLGRLEGAAANGRAATEPNPQRTSLAQDVRAILRSPLLLSIAGLTVLLALLVNVGMYQFFLALQANFGGKEEAMVVFLARYNLVAGLVALFVQGYLASRVMRSYGVFVALLFFPLGVALAAAVGLVTGGALLAMAMIRGSDPVFRRTISDAALNTLYLPVPAKLRGQAKGILEALYALTFGMAGVAFLVMQRFPDWSYVHWGVPLIGLATIWCASLLTVRRRYLQTLAENVSRRQLDLSAVRMDVTDETTARVLAQALADPDALRVLYALELISDAPEGDWQRWVVPLLAHPSPEVRLQALAYLTRQPAALDDAEHLQELLEAPEEEVRAAALGAYGASTGEAGLAELRRALADPSPRVAGAAAAALMVYGGPAGVQLAAPHLDAMLVSPDAAVRREGGRALGLMGNRNRGAMLLPLFDDLALEVQQSALGAARMLRSPEFLPHLIGKLEHPALAPVASEAVAAYGEEALPALAGVLRNPKRSRSEGVWAVRTLQRLGGREATETLLAHLRDPDGAVRLAICRSLAQQEPGGLFSLEEVVKEALFDEVHNAYRLQVLSRDLRSTALLKEALETRFAEALERILLLLGLHYPDRGLQRARAALQRNDAGRRAMALELLDHVLERGLKPLVLPLLEAPVAHVLALAQSHFGLASESLEDRLKELTAGSDSWLRMCAVYEIGILGRLDLVGPVLAALLSDDPLLRETALVSCQRLLEPTQLTQLLNERAANDPSPVVGLYAKMMLGTKST